MRIAASFVAKSSRLWARGLATVGRRPYPVIRTVGPPAEDRPGHPAALERSLAAEASYAALKARCEAGGGENAVRRHVEKNGKVLVRDRLRRIFDGGFLELSVTAGMGLEYGDVPCAGTVTGIGRVSGTRCMVLANDATVKGGSSYPITVTKSLRAQEVAADNRLPCIYLVDSGGAFLPLQSEIYPDRKHGGRTFHNQAAMSASGIPQIALVSGLCTAGAAYTPCMADEALMVHRIANVYLGGPPLVKAALGEAVSGEDLGGATLHCSVSGVADHFAAQEEDSFEAVRDVVASLGAAAAVEEEDEDDDPPLVDPRGLDYYAGLEAALNREEILEVLSMLLDGSRFREFKAMFGTNLVCGYGRVGGRAVGVVANCGPLEAAEGQKAAHFVNVCDSRDLPLVYVQNSGPVAGGGGGGGGSAEALKERGKASRCLANARVPKVTLNATGAFGDDHYVLCGPAFAPRFYFTWPRSTIGNAEGGVVTAQQAASTLISDGIVLPRETRDVLAEAVAVCMANHVPSSTLHAVREAMEFEGG